MSALRLAVLFEELDGATCHLEYPCPSGPACGVRDQMVVGNRWNPRCCV